MCFGSPSIPTPPKAPPPPRAPEPVAETTVSGVDQRKKRKNRTPLTIPRPSVNIPGMGFKM